LLLVNAPITVLGNQDHVGDALAPGQFIGMMLVGPDKNHRTFVGRNPLGQAIPGIKILREPQIQNIDELVDGSGRPRAAKNDHVLLRAANGLEDDTAGVLPKTCRLQARARGFGMGIGVQRQHLFGNKIFDKLQGAAAGRVVGIGHAPVAVRPVQGTIVPDDRIANLLDQMLDIGLHGLLR